MAWTFHNMTPWHNRLLHYHLISPLGCRLTDLVSTPRKHCCGQWALNTNFLSLYPNFTKPSSIRDLGKALNSPVPCPSLLLHLTRSCFYNMRRLRASRYVSSSVFLTTVHACICSRIDYCNCIYAGLPKTRLSYIQSVLNSAASHRPSPTLLSTLMTDVQNWLPLTFRIQYKVLLLADRAQKGQLKISEI